MRFFGGGFKDFCVFTPNIGEDFSILTRIFFQMGWFNHQSDDVGGGFDWGVGWFNHQCNFGSNAWLFQNLKEAVVPPQTPTVSKYLSPLWQPFHFIR